MTPPAATQPRAGSTGSGWRARLISEAAALTRREGWTAVTMARLAGKVGVSRQTVYNELGSKTALAEALVLHELEGFLAEVDDAFEQNPTDIVAAIRGAAHAVLELAAVNPLLHAVLAAGHGADSDLLPLLTTRSEPLIDAARQVIGDRIGPYDIPLEQAEIDAAVDMVVRLVLSYVMRPAVSPERTADHIAWMARRVLQGV